MFERLPFDCAMFDGNVDIPEDKIDDETLPKIRVFRVQRLALRIRWKRSVLGALHLYSGDHFCFDKILCKIGKSAVSV